MSDAARWSSGGGSRPVDPADGASARRNAATVTVTFALFAAFAVVMLALPLRAQAAQVLGLGHVVTATVTRVEYVPPAYKSESHDLVTVRWTDATGQHTGTDAVDPGEDEVGDTVRAHVLGASVSLQSDSDAIAGVCLFTLMLVGFGLFTGWGATGWRRLRALPVVGPDRPAVRAVLSPGPKSRGALRCSWRAVDGSPEASGRLLVFGRADQSFPSAGETVEIHPWSASGRGPFLLRSPATGRWSFATGRRLPVRPAAASGHVAPPLTFDR